MADIQISMSCSILHLTLPSHVTPLYPSGQVHSYLVPFSIHNAPFLQGFGLHWFTAENEKFPSLGKGKTCTRK